eukprot:TRINITY_DN1036_c0_g1_i1.p1 TRINITY_DN1036_c0_g1~~TRINITY_DN1036_c0_g1_i1.p1  ORF type:complete len:292 (+),score=76.32 TRINITY_DN1036_c0_g1_i1:95-970(+)
MKQGYNKKSKFSRKKNYTPNLSFGVPVDTYTRAIKTISFPKAQRDFEKVDLDEGQLANQTGHLEIPKIPTRNFKDCLGRNTSNINIPVIVQSPPVGLYDLKASKKYFNTSSSFSFGSARKNNSSTIRKEDRSTFYETVDLNKIRPTTNGNIGINLKKTVGRESITSSSRIKRKIPPEPKLKPKNVKSIVKKQESKVQKIQKLFKKMDALLLQQKLPKKFTYVDYDKKISDDDFKHSLSKNKVDEKEKSNCEEEEENVFLISPINTDLSSIYLNRRIATDNSRNYIVSGDFN